jgi:uncharacterized protein (DUF1499 family)
MNLYFTNGKSVERRIDGIRSLSTTLLFTIMNRFSDDVFFFFEKRTSTGVLLRLRSSSRLRALSDSPGTACGRRRLTKIMRI